MSKTANPAKIGLFVVLGLALGVGGILLFSSARWFSNTERYVLYFDSSVKGLSPGAPVKYRGVTIGSVSEIMIRLNQAENDLHIPVIIEVNADLLREKTDRTKDWVDEESFNAVVKKGLRGVLQAQSFVTGLLYIELEIQPTASPPVFHQQKKVYKEIPTASSNIQQLMDDLSQLDLKGLTDKLNSVLAKLDADLGELRVREISAGLTNLLTSLNRLAISPELTNAPTALRQTLDEVRLLSTQVRTRLHPLADNAENLFKQAELTLVELRGGVEDLRGLIAPQSPLRHELIQAVDELGRAAQSFSALAEFLRRNPNALLSGRKQPERSP